MSTPSLLTYDRIVLRNPVISLLIMLLIVAGFATQLVKITLAAAAGQDFSRAKELARQAVRLQPLPLHKKTLVWIELRQRDYHKSFGLPAPPEGWFLTH